MVEIWDAYDRNFNKIENMKLVRGEVIPNGLYHLVCDIIVKHTDGTYLLMQRDLKKHYGGLWELTAGGSALANETPIDCALRELREETGIISFNLDEIGRTVHDGHHSIYVVYLCITDYDKTAVTLQKGETINYRWVEMKTILEMTTNEFASPRSLEILKRANI